MMWLIPKQDTSCFCLGVTQFWTAFLTPHLSFQRSKAGCFGILCFVGHPQTTGYMLDKAERISVLDFWNSHAFYISFVTGTWFLLDFLFHQK